MDRETAIETAMMLARHGGLPSRDLLLAMDQAANIRETLDTISENVDDMKTANTQSQPNLP